MSAHVLQSHLRRLAAEVGAVKVIVLGKVTSFDPNTYTARVTIQPSGIETGWLPVKTLWVGNGWGLFCPPSKDDQVEVAFQDGSIESGVVQGAVFSDEQRPLPTPQGEWWLVHQLGAFIKLTNDGKLTLRDKAGSTVILNGDGTITSSGAWTHTGSFTATAEVTANGGHTVSAHTHTVPNDSHGDGVGPTRTPTG